MEDIEIIQNIRAGRREKPIALLYKEFGKIRKMVVNNGGDSAVAEDVFQDALVLLIEKVSDPAFELTSKLSTYLYGLAFYIWKNEVRKSPAFQELPSENIILDAIEYDAEKEERLQYLSHVLEKVSDKCKEIFERFYFKKESMKVIATALNFSSENSAKTQKYKCLEQAIAMANHYSPLNTAS
jgi:RNA polymerase sigma factor (sigma-70 family)